MQEKINFINVDDLEFYTSDTSLLFLRYKGEDLGRVSIIRMFPFKYEEEYIVIRQENYSRFDKENEIGILRAVNELPESQAKLVFEELKKRYFIPEIISVSEVKEEFGSATWKTVTTAGERDFTMTDLGTNVRSLANNKVMLTDVYGNRYYIPDITKMDDKTQKVLEIWI
ncbi:MAG: DUF1854 domain-containing protein [Clostridia bacterium]|nr:DUF1854 domain-containing protein [Clostridia bacterium]